jgi:hypothetical protein
MASRDKRYHQAALTYLIYGLLYWSGGFYLIAQGISEQSGIGWFIVGALFILIFPPLIWHGARRKALQWFTRILALFVLIRVLGLARVILNDEGQMVPLPWDGSVSMRLGTAVFLVIAAGTCFMLARAGWSEGDNRHLEPSP